MTIGALGWTLKALSCETLTRYYQENVKKAIARLEDEGVFVGDRPRGRGMNVRVLTLSPSLASGDELENLLREAVKVWPEDADGVRRGMSSLRPKTQAHLRKRGLS
jgi:hypothetical protein